MADRMQLLALEMSPYSVKLRSYLRYKGISFEWITRGPRTEKLYQRHAKVQLIPLVIFPDGSSMQDSTIIMEHLETLHPEPSMHPAEPAARFLSELLEEFGDEWCNKLMFQYRWGPLVDQKSSASRIARAGLEGHRLRPFWPIAAVFLRRRMVPRMAFAGANPTNRPHLEASWHRTIEILEAHLADRPYLFGGRPAFGDFGIWGQVHQASTDVTAGGHLRESAPAVLRWVDRMSEPVAEGEFEPLDALLPTLSPLLEEQIAGRFLPWSVANAKAYAAAEPQTCLEFDGELYEQKTFKYHAWSLGQLREKLERVASDPALRSVLEETGCAAYLDLDLPVP